MELLQLTIFTHRGVRYFCNIQITNKMHFNAYDVFYSQCSHQHVSAAIADIFRVILLLLLLLLLLQE
jgi:hypothetical protein